jgi:hypothetical protein
VRLGVRQALDLRHVEVGVDFGAWVFSVSAILQDTSARLGVQCNRLSLITSFVHRASTHGMDKDRCDSRLLEPGLGTLQNRFGPLEVVGISL